jgi:hypothetical protein
MTNPQSTPEAVVWVAIDVAKDRHEALIEAPGWKSRKKFHVHHTAQEFRAFAEFLHGLALPVRIGFEPTGNYHHHVVTSASLRACGVGFPFAIPTSIWRSSVTICSALYLFMG